MDDLNVYEFELYNNTAFEVRAENILEAMLHVVKIDNTHPGAIHSVTEISAN